MGRPSKRGERRAHITAAFARMLADHGYSGATIAAVAAEAGVAPGLVHHHFSDKQDLLASLMDDLVARFRRLRDRESGEMDRPADPVVAYTDAALALDDTADVIAARCWVGVLAESVRDPALFRQTRRLLDAEVAAIQRRSAGSLSAAEASAVLAFILGSLVFGAFAPRKTAGFAAPFIRRVLAVIGRR
jgi:TetR/AcrR family transcriptional repressor of bet genes